MAAELLVRILSMLLDAGRRGESARLCEVAAEVTGMSGAGIMLLDDNGSRGSLCTSDGISGRLEELQYTYGEGPCIDAYHADGVVLEPSLAAAGPRRWPAFSPAAVTAGAGAVFGFPMRAGAARVGALNLYRGSPGPMSDGHHAAALVMADVAARAVLAMQAGAQPGSLAAELQLGADFHSIVHQAAGMVSVQLDISVAEAIIRLRAHAFAANLPINEVAGAVVSRQLRFGEPPNPGSAGP